MASVTRSTGTIWAALPANRPTRACWVSRIGAAVSASMNDIRSAGYSGSMGTYAAPALRIAYSETTISSERSMQTATREPGPARSSTR